jgi:D-3-phosphoglycerate dehydrogenase
LRAATDRNIDWTNVQGTGRGGRIRERDVLAAAAKSGEGQKINQVRPAKIVVTDWTFADLGIEESILTPLGHQVVGHQCKTEADLISLVVEADCVITQFARVNANVIDAMTKARVIVRYGIGVDNVDLQAARHRGIPVCNVPDYCIDEVADHTLAFILAATRQVVPHTNKIRAGEWGLAVPLTGMKALRDLTVGVVGFGRIGREVVRRLLPFKCQVLVFDPVVSPAEVERAGARPVASFDELLCVCDVITLHCPLTPQSRKMINASALAKLKAGAILINVARGDLVDTPALVTALESGQLAAAALDVCDPEPIPRDHPLLKLPNIILAPHIASASPPAVRKLRETAAKLAGAAASGELPPNVVNGVSAPRSVS